MEPHRFVRVLTVGFALAWLAASPALAQTSPNVDSGSTPTTQPQAQHHPAPLQRQQITDLMKRVMNFQIKAYGDTAPVDWQAAAFWSGVMGAYQTTGDEDFYQAAKHWAQAADWKCNKRPFHADDIAAGQSYTEMYQREKQPKMIEDLKSKVDLYFAKQNLKQGEVGRATWRQQQVPFSGRNLWWWCDALYMAPPTLTRLAAVTGDHRYLDLLHRLYWDSVDHLFDPAESLFFRDANYFPDHKTSPTGRKIFWGRGNGWVYAGIIRTLDYLPKDSPDREKYIELFKKMTAAVVKYQGEDGLWRASLNEPSWFPQPETSGSSFFCYGLLAGINRGYLDRATYEPAALRAWAGLCSHVDSEGLLGYAQSRGASPAASEANSFQDYANGAFLLAGSEMYRLNPSGKAEEVSR